MQTMDHQNPYVAPLFLANLLNQDPFKPPSKLKLAWATLYWFCTVFNAGLCLYTVSVIDMAKGMDVANIVVSCMSFFHGLGKLILLLYLKDKFGEIIVKSRELEYIYENIEPKLFQEIQAWLKYTMLFCKIYSYVGVSLTFTYYIKAWMYQELPMPLIIPDHPLIPFRFVLFTQMVFMSIVIFIFINDMMVIISCVYILTFYKSLHSKIQLVNLEDNNEMGVLNEKRLFELSRDHLRIIEHAKFLEKTLTHTFGLQLLITLGSATTQLYLLQTSGYATEQVVQSIIYMALVVGELGCYCFTIDLVLTEAAKTSNYFYNLNWYKGNFKTTKALIVLIHYAQKPLEFTASGLTQINNTTFVMVCRFAISIYTFMNSLVNH